MKSTKTLSLVFLCFFIFVHNGFSLGQIQYVENVFNNGDFPIVQGNAVANLYVDSSDFAGVVRAAGDLQTDVVRVTGFAPTITHNVNNPGNNVIIVGTIGKSQLISQLISSGKIDVSPITNQWESFILQVVPSPLPGVASALVIVGSDKRGTIYGIYDLSEEMGVSPWYYWADVPVQHQNFVFVKPGRYEQGPPSVKYRGIFLNDESPDLSKWIQAKYLSAPNYSSAVNYGQAFYTNLFEVLLRLKANYLWPAMWSNAFNEDDTNNPVLADKYGIVMGTSHQEPMLRAQQEWDRRYRNTLGNWNYYTQSNVLLQFWRDGIRRNKNYESILTMGLRGENDSEMIPGGTDAQSMALLTNIVSAQRSLVAQELNPDVTRVPQLWCPYKEVLAYYNEGFRVPDDVTILWTDDNWGDIRRLPIADERARSGGAGIYYHIDYHGGPRSYQWINTSPISKIWDQLSLAGQYGADRVWIVNVGHFKGYEFPIEYFMNLAWNSSRWTNGNINEYTRSWAAREFGTAYADTTADIISSYTKYNGRTKPELLTPNTYSPVNYQEADRMLADFQAITNEAFSVYNALSAEKRDAFYELVLFPALASEQVNELYAAAGRNILYARQGRVSANDWINRVQTIFQNHVQLLNDFNVNLVGGKWNHFQDQYHIGPWFGGGWQDLQPAWNQNPSANSLSVLNQQMQSVTPLGGPSLGVAVENSAAAWPGTSGNPVLPTFDALNQQTNYIDVFNRGDTSFSFTATADKPWIVLSETNGIIGNDRRLWVTIDWTKVPSGTTNSVITITGANANVNVEVNTFNPAEVTRDTLSSNSFAEGDGFVSIEAAHFTTNSDAGANRWIPIEDYGRTLSGMRSTQPVNVPSATPGVDSPSLQYRMYLFNPGVVDVDAILSPTLNFVPDRGLRYAISFDDQPPQVITFVPQGYNTQNYPPDWMDSVTTGARPVHSSHTLTASGYHTLKFWMVDPGVVLEKLVVDLGGVKPSYLGPPESFYKTVINATNLPPVAVASANPTSGSAPLSVTFSSAGSLDPEGLSLTYRWTFGDGTISTAANPNHNYSAAGTYAATLNVSDGVNTVGSSNITITVTNPRPTSPLNLRLINP